MGQRLYKISPATLPGAGVFTSTYSIFLLIVQCLIMADLLKKDFLERKNKTLSLLTTQFEDDSLMIFR